MVSVKQLMSAIEEAEPFQMPEMNAGTHYLYDELYARLTSGKTLCFITLIKCLFYALYFC